MKKIKAKFCPFCYGYKIGVIENRADKGILKNSLIISAYCKCCKAQGPMHYRADKTELECYNYAMELWNDRKTWKTFRALNEDKYSDD